MVLSYRAHSPGGVAVAPGDPANGEKLIAWAGIDNKEPQVFLTMVGEGGKKTAQRMLTHSKNGVSDVALSFVGDGWVVAWIDERSGASEVHVVKVDRKLKSITDERRIGATAGNATGVQLLARGDHVFVVWSDARGPSAGIADIFAARLAAKDLSSVGPERAVAETPAHSRSPTIAAFGEGAVVVWVEDPLRGSEQASSVLMMARLDSGAEPISGSVTQATLSGSPEGVGLSCGTGSCRVVASVSTGDAGRIEAFEWSPDRQVTPRHLVDLETPPRDAVAPVLIDGDVFYADEGRPGDARVRRIGVAWQ